MPTTTKTKNGKPATKQSQIDDVLGRAVDYIGRSKAKIAAIKAESADFAAVAKLEAKINNAKDVLLASNLDRVEGKLFKTTMCEPLQTDYKQWWIDCPPDNPTDYQSYGKRRVNAINAR